MSAVVCPFCNATLPAKEIAAGWCESCGKKVPSFAYREAGVSGPRVEPVSFSGERRFGDRAFSYSDGRALASRMSRLGAALLDGFLTLVFIGPGYGLIFVAAQEQKDQFMLLGLGMLLVGGLILAAVQITLLSTSGQTVGKKMVGVRIVQFKDGSNPGFVGAVLLRNFVPGMIASIPCLGGIFSLVDILFIFGEERRCIHDLIASTKVVEA
jgi:uncharacterized RDD family membrane protein YckC